MRDLRVGLGTLLVAMVLTPVWAEPVGEPLSSDVSTTEPDSKLTWYPAQKLTLQGKGWKDTATWSSRLPQRWLEKVPEGPRNLASNSTGVAVRFATNATSISAAWDSKPPMN